MRGVPSLKKYAIEQTCSCRPAGEVASTRTFAATVTESASGPPPYGYVCTSPTRPYALTCTRRLEAPAIGSVELRAALPSAG